jgi:hypothetical protein
MSFDQASAVGLWLLLRMTLVVWCVSVADVVGNAASTGDDLWIEVTQKGAGKQVVILQGAKEWFMLVDVTPENAVVIRQEKEHDRYLVDESETYDRPISAAEVVRLFLTM